MWVVVGGGGGGGWAGHVRVDCFNMMVVACMSSPPTCSLNGAANCFSVSSSLRWLSAGSALAAAASHTITPKSLMMAAPTPGWRTLTATVVPAGTPVTAEPLEESTALGGGRGEEAGSGSDVMMQALCTLAEWWRSRWAFSRL